MKRPLKPKIKEPNRPRKPKAPSKLKTSRIGSRWEMNKVVRALGGIKTPIVLENDEIKIKITQSCIQVLTPDTTYEQKLAAYQAKMKDYNAEIEKIRPQLASYDKAMAQWELDVARYEAEQAEKKLLKAKKKVYG